MQAKEATALLRFGLPESETNELQNLAQRLGEWPLLLKMVNAFLFKRVVNKEQDLSEAIAYVTKRLDKYGIIAFDAKNAEDLSQAVEATISVSLELLDDEEKKRFKEVAIFPEDIGIPLDTVEKLWFHAGLDELDTEDLCDRLFSLSLLLNFDPNNRSVRLHDVIRSYLRKKNEAEIHNIHQSFLDAFGIHQWADLPDSEPYLWKNLAYHLTDGGQSEKLKSILCDYHFLRKKLSLNDVNALLEDFDYLPDDRELKLIQSALRLSATQLTQDPG